MIRTFVEVPLFTNRWKEIGLDDDELLKLQLMLLRNPEAGPVMEGTGGIRKVRFPLKDRGKKSIKKTGSIIENRSCEEQEMISWERCLTS